MTEYNSGDQVALAVDDPKKPAFPWPFADRTPSYKPGKFLPMPLDSAPTVWKSPDPSRWPLYMAGFFAFAVLGAFIAAAFIKW